MFGVLLVGTGVVLVWRDRRRSGPDRGPRVRADDGRVGGLRARCSGWWRARSPGCCCGGLRSAVALTAVAGAVPAELGLADAAHDLARRGHLRGAAVPGAAGGRARLGGPARVRMGRRRGRRAAPPLRRRAGLLRLPLHRSLRRSAGAERRSPSGPSRACCSAGCTCCGDSGSPRGPTRCTTCSWRWRRSG